MALKIEIKVKYLYFGDIIISVNFKIHYTVIKSYWNFFIFGEHISHSVFHFQVMFNISKIVSGKDFLMISLGF